MSDMLDVSRWQLTDKGTELPMPAEGDPTVLVLASNVRFWGQSGHQSNVVGMSAFDPKR
jgi:hypothetical protein